MSKQFVQRHSTPGAKDKNFMHYTKGGVNYCINIEGDSVLPNCVGYAWGRWRELLGAFHKLSRANAEDWYGHNDGYKRGQTPKLGAVICWSQGRLHDGRDGAGHVAIVEEIHADGSITISNSDYGGSKFYRRHLPKGFNIGAGFKFQGFIYPPVDFQNGSKKVTQALIDEVWAGKWGNGQDRINRLNAAGYNAKEVNAAVDANPPSKPKPSTPKKSNAEMAKEVLAGKWGNGADRKNRLTKAGYNYAAIQAIVDGQTSKKSNQAMAQEVLAGKWGNGADRRNRLTAAGYNYDAIQAIVDGKAGKTNEQLAREVIAGKWGNGAERKNRLTKAGYNYAAIQRIVERLV